MVDLLDAFLIASSVAYLLLLVSPKPATWIKSPVLEKLLFGIMGTLILTNLFYFDFSLSWFGLVVLYVAGCLWSYVGYLKWRVFWKGGMSEAAQMAMAFWDLMISVICFTKISNRSPLEIFPGKHLQ